ncbi:P1 family peptidase [Rhodobacteraceae bacterium F11138]|nr:P1 family peptidase [Rhodobacteraceae bacterium F11138]
MRNLITDVPGLRVGNAKDEAVRTGVTVLLPDRGAICAVDVRGGAPGTRETDLLDPACLSERADAIVLSGGSLFGLDAASGAMHWLRKKGRGGRFLDATIPSVPSAIIFDQHNEGDKSWQDEHLYFNLAKQAAEAADLDFALGTEGAGTGTKAGGLKGGLGSASQKLHNGATVGALVVVNSFGQVVMPGSRRFWAADFERAGEFGACAEAPPPAPVLTEIPEFAEPGLNTTLAVIATDLTLTKAQLKRVAMVAQDGLARAIHPVHTPFDGDVIFCLSTGQRAMGTEEVDVTRLGMAAVECLARATARGVYEATPLGPFPTYRSLT